jgi:phenylacetate-CoA ligase
MNHPLFLLNKLRRNLRLEREELENIQLKKLNALITHAYENVPYYRNLFTSARLVPSDIRNIDDITRIPTTSKITLQSQKKEEIVAKGIDIDTCVEDVTSGSTGIPLHVYFTEDDYLTRSLLFIRTFMATGYKLTDRQAVITDTRFVSNKKYWFQKVGIFRKEYIPVQLSMDKQIDLLKKYMPDYIHGYPQSIALVADEMLKRGIHTIKPRMVCTGAELVSKRTREVINSTFGVNMVDTYATIESGIIAWECPEYRGYHVNIDSTVLELLKNGKRALPGERGKVVITNLHSFAMPIIRYELGDICIASDYDCPCGNALPLMSIVEGRSDDMVYTPSGKMVSPNSITNALEAVDGIKQFRVIQEDKENLILQLVKGDGYQPDTPQKAQGLLNELTGERMEVRVEIANNIPRDPSGKIRAVISQTTSRKKED